MTQYKARQLDPFLGREAELVDLKRYLKKTSASIIVVRGRRRIGKSRLIQEFGKNLNFHRFSGVAPNPSGQPQPSQLKQFAYQLSVAFGIPEPSATDWNNLFHILAAHTSTGRQVILLDEISWMAADDTEFLAKLQYAWEELFKKNPELILFICGSASAWIEKNILSSTGFYGRVSYVLTLEELPLRVCNKFWDGVGATVSAYDKFKMLAVTGGIPRYLEEIDPTQPAETNILNLCYKRGGVLADDFERIFSDIFGARSEAYKKIVQLLLEESLDYSEICERLGVSKSGLMSEYLSDLTISGFISRDHSWHIKSGDIAELTSRYRLRDNYLRYYLKYIEKHLVEIEKNTFQIKNLSSIPAWSSIMGLQFENLVLNNRDFILHKLNLSRDIVIRDNPYYQRATTKNAGCQIDYLIQTQFNTLFAIEVKFSRQAVGMDVITEVQEKIKRLKLPKNYSCFPVLLHVNGVTDNLIDSGYFASIIDFKEVLE